MEELCTDQGTAAKRGVALPTLTPKTDIRAYAINPKERTRRAAVSREHMRTENAAHIIDVYQCSPNGA